MRPGTRSGARAPVEDQTSASSKSTTLTSVGLTWEAFGRPPRAAFGREQRFEAGDEIVGVGRLGENVVGGDDFRRNVAFPDFRRQFV